MTTTPGSEPNQQLQNQSQPPPSQTELDPSGLIGASISLASISVGIAAFVPSLSRVSQGFRGAVAILSSILAVLSTINALWLLAHHWLGEQSASVLIQIATLLIPTKGQQYWLMAMVLVLLLLLSVWTVILAVGGVVL